MFAKINKAEKEYEVEGCVNLGALRANLTTPAWAPLEDANSILSKVLLSDAFKNEKNGTAACDIDANWLRCFALLHCQGKDCDKARALYEIL